MGTIPEYQRRKIKSAFRSVLNGAKRSSAQFDLFEPDVERFVRETAIRLAYEKGVRFGGSRSQYFVDKFRRVLMICENISQSEEEDELLDEVIQFSFLFRSTLARYKETIGFSFSMMKSPYATAKGKSGGMLEKWKEIAYQLRRLRKHELAWAFEQLVAGYPNIVCDFKIKPLYMLVREISRVNEYIRVVELENGNGKRSAILEMVADDFSDPRHFRKFALKNGPFTFGIGEGAGIRDLNQIQQDVNKLLHGKEVYEQNEFGWREVPRSKAEDAPKLEGDYSGTYSKSGLWFFDDVVITPTGEMIVPKKNRIVKWDNRNYALGKRGHEEQAFVVDAPTMKINIKYQDIEFDIKEDNQRFSGKNMSDQEVVSALFREFYLRLHDTIGGENAGYVLGMILSYACAPEIFGERGEFPGLWLHGKASSGKTHIGQWLMEIWGFHNIKPLELKGNMVTAVGLNNALSQSSNLPVFCDEFKAGQVDDGKLSVVHNAYNRAKGAKYASPGMERREPKTSLLIAGETTSSDPAARGRYAHAPVSANLRSENHWDWFLETSKHFCLIGRYILTNRGQFVDEQIRELKNWMSEMKTEIPDERQRFVYGTGYSGFMAAVDLFESHHSEECEKVKKAAIKASVEGAINVEDDIEVNRFWLDVCDLYSRGLIERHFFHFRSDYIAHAPGCPNQKNWKEVVMYFQPGPIISIVNESRRKGGQPRTLERKDLASQMKTEDYWIEGKLRQRFGEGKRVCACWGISLDKHPLGFKAITDKEWIEIKDTTTECSDNDPRCAGELYSIYFRGETTLDELEGEER